jgi:hypothetical protein
MFIWSFCPHTVLPLAEVGVRMLIMDPDKKKVELWEPMIFDEKNKA